MYADDELPEGSGRLWKDPVVEEAREAGRWLEARGGGGVHGLFEYLRQAETKYPDRLVDTLERELRIEQKPAGASGVR